MKRVDLSLGLCQRALTSGCAGDCERLHLDRVTNFRVISQEETKADPSGVQTELLHTLTELAKKQSAEIEQIMGRLEGQRKFNQTLVRVLGNRVESQDLLTRDDYNRAVDDVIRSAGAE